MNDPYDQLSPEQREQMEEALERARSAVGDTSRIGLAGLAGLIVRAAARRMIPRPRSWLQMVRRPRFRLRKLAYLGVALLVAVLSVATCSTGVELESLSAEYGEPAPASAEAARSFLERTLVLLNSAASSGRLRVTVTEAEATSVLSLGLVIPEVMQAARTLSPEQLEGTDDIEELRALLRQHQTSPEVPRSFRERVAAALDPRLRTSDVQVHFSRRGEVVVAGYLQAWRWQQPALVVFAPRAESGELELDFVEGRLGRLPAPGAVFDLFGELVSSLILQGRDYAEISELTVDENRLTFEALVTR